MKEFELRDRLKLLEKEIALLGKMTEGIKFDMKERIDDIKIELGALKAYLSQLDPDFKKKYPRIKKKVLTGIEPERLL